MSNPNFNHFRLEDIAAWGLDDLWKNTETKCYASLPPIQRGFVWKAEQVETLWDSIAQGFPIGSLLLEQWDNTQKRRPYEGVDMRDSSPTWQLLDGQQRATSIIKGFQDIWSHSNSKPVSALWVDLAPKDMAETDRRFLFRLVTKSHPWGYEKKKPSKRLSASETYKALNAFRKLYCHEDSCNMKPHDFSLRSVFPWDAEAPVPLALLFEAIKQTKNGDMSSVAKILRNLLKKSLPIWETWSSMSDNKKLEVTHFSKVDEELSKPGEHFKSLVVMLRNALDNFCIPAPELNLEKRNNNESTADEHHPTFNLFKRVNSGGTVLSNEEIQYSLLKSVWPNAPSIIEGEILNNCQLCQPARMVSLMARLYLMSMNQTPEGKVSNITGLQSALKIAEFQNMLKHGQKDFEDFCEGRGEKLVKATWGLLVYNKFVPHKFGLPKVLAARIAGSHPDLLLLLMYWYHQLGANNLSEEQQRRSLGFVTALAWFAQDEKGCIQRLAKELKEESFKDYPNFLNNERFDLLLKKDEQGRILMVQLRSPVEVEKAFKIQLGDALSNFEHEFWKKKEFWGLYPVKDTGEDTGSWYPSSDAERFFLHKVFDDPNWSKLVYAQRSLIEKWYGESFDPTQPKLIQDRNRPWDYDHILPKNWVNRKKLPKLIQTWLGAIGNFRAWPLEHNRSKGDNQMIEKNLPDYELNDQKGVLEASFIRSENLKEWNVLCTKVEGGSKFWDDDNKEAWSVFIEASLLRTVDIYREWYQELKVEQLTIKGVL